MTREQEKIIAEQLKSGGYRYAENVISQSLGMLRAQERFIQSNIAELREKIDVGIQQIRRGEVVDGKTAIEKVRQSLRQRKRDGR